MFVNRTAELTALDRWWNAPTRRAGLVWGRRRVGKTALLQRFARDKRAVFHTGAGRASAGELAQLSRQVAAAGLDGVRDLAARPFGSWDDALDHLAERRQGEPLLLVLDEFPELAAASPDLPGVLRAFLDRVPGQAGLRLLLCGSAVRSMQALAEERAPLYGRFDLNLPLHPFRPHEAALMLPDLPPADQALVYGTVGGMPLYLAWWDQTAPVADNLRRLACEPGAPLLTEGQLVLATEAEPGEQPAAVLHAIAAGKTRHADIKNWIRAEPSRTLDRLVQLRLVDRLQPVTEREDSRQRRYRIADNFLAFYLGVLSRYRGEIERGLGSSILPVLMESLDDHMGPVWEQTFRDHLRRLAAQGRLGEGIVAVGPWWTPDGQFEIDALALAGRSRRPVLAGEAKWARREDARRVVRDLALKAARLVDDPDSLRYAVCAREEVVLAPEGTLVVTAADVFGRA
jgi:AAA+ ATPase superfamily predicted ATPase